MGEGAESGVEEGSAWDQRKRFDLRELRVLGEILDRRPGQLQGETTGEYLAKKLLRIRGKDGGRYPLKANAVQREYERRRGLGNIVLKARQMGLTTWVSGRFLLKTVCQPGTLSLQVAHTQDAAEEMFAIVRRFVDHLPVGLKAGALRAGKLNVRQIVFPEIDSEYRVVSAADRNAGRGLTYQNLHCSEVARWGSGGSAEASDVLAGLLGGLVPRGEYVLESTPEGVGGCFYDEWVRAGEGLDGGPSSGMVRHFFPWWLETGYRSAAVDAGSLTEEERELMARPGVELDLRQIGFRRGLRTRVLKLVRQEYAEDAESCFLVSGEPYFELEALQQRMTYTCEPLEKRYNGRLEIWWPPVPGKRYVVSVDPAGGGVEGDYSVIEVLDLDTGLQCAEFSGHVGGMELMHLVREIAWDYETAWVVVERNNHGGEQLGLLGANGYRRIFKGTDGQAGFLTTMASRPRILAELSMMLLESPELFYSLKLLRECRTFVRRPNGEAGARSGTYDDRVMAIAIGYAARKEILGLPPAIRDKSIA